MSVSYKTPGVYVEEISRLPPSVAPVETAIPAFIGYTQFATNATANDLVLVPWRITSMVDYVKFFGNPDPETKISVVISTNPDGTTKTSASLAESDRSPHNMYYALQLFFANGGGPCYIVSVAPYKALDKADLEAGLAKIAKEDEPTLIVFPEAQNLTNIAHFEDVHDQALQQCALLQDRFVIMDTHGGATSLSLPSTDITSVMTNFRTNGTPNNNLKYGAAYAPNLATSLTFVYSEADTDVKVGASAAVKMNTLVNTIPPSDNQSYNLAKAAIVNMPLNMPPAAAMAGIYAAVDNARGVWKAPANVSVSTCIQPTIQITNGEQDGMNVDPGSGKSVNAIRAFVGKGSLVWGARTLAGNDNEWRYINVRRFCIFAEESIKKATMQFVFEPNDANTWVKVQGMIENFLTTLWRQGALQGVKPEDAFYVSVGLGKTMTADDVLEGRMIVEIGLCPVRPAEFIILQFVQTLPVS